MGYPVTQDAANRVSVLHETPPKRFTCEYPYSYRGDISTVPLQIKPRLEDLLFTHAGSAIDAHLLILLPLSPSLFILLVCLIDWLITADSPRPSTALALDSDFWLWVNFNFSRKSRCMMLLTGEWHHRSQCSCCIPFTFLVPKYPGCRPKTRSRMVTSKYA